MEENIKRSKSDDISLNELIFKIHKGCLYLLSKWIVIVFFGILGGVLGFAYAWVKQPIYTAATTFVLENGENTSGGLGQYAGLASMVGIDIGGAGGGGIFQGDNILELYKSRAMIEKTLLSETDISGKKELLIDRYIFFNKLHKAWAENKNLKNIQFSDLGKKNRLQDSVIGLIVNDINANSLNVSKPDKKLSIIQVEIKSKDEIFAKIFNDEIVKNVNDFYVQTKTKKSIDNIAILQHKTDSVKSVMNGAIYSAAVAVDQTPNINPTRQALRAAPVQRSQFTAETNKAVLGELVKNLEMSKMALLKETPLIQVIDKPIYPLEKEKLGKAKGMVSGGLLFGFLCTLFLFVKKVLAHIIKHY